MSFDVGAWLLVMLKKFLNPVFSGGVPIVKKIQRGVTTGTSVTISTVNPDKCLVMLNGSGSTMYKQEDTFLKNGNTFGGIYAFAHNNDPYFTGLTATMLSLAGHSGETISWQVIEFY